MGAWFSELQRPTNIWGHLQGQTEPLSQVYDEYLLFSANYREVDVVESSCLSKIHCILNEWIQKKGQGHRSQHGCFAAVAILGIWYSAKCHCNSLVSKVLNLKQNFCLKKVPNSQFVQPQLTAQGHTIMLCSCCSHLDVYTCMHLIQVGLYALSLMIAAVVCLVELKIE